MEKGDFPGNAMDFDQRTTNHISGHAILTAFVGVAQWVYAAGHQQICTHLNLFAC
jgi:hypothetical protein